MNIILFGPQGCGKGTQAELIVKNFGLLHISTGDLLRAEIKTGSEFGKEIAGIINAGSLVPDDMINKLMLKKAKESKKGIIFDGYPRKDTQLDFIVKNFKISAAIEISLSEDESIKRIASRRMCTKCGKNYNIIYIKPKAEGKCDIDGASLIQRDDDKPVEIKKRLEIYKKMTEPLKKYYKENKILHVIDGNRPIDDVYKDIEKVLKKA